MSAGSRQEGSRQDVKLLQQEVSSTVAHLAESQEKLSSLRVQHHLTQREVAVLRGQVCFLMQDKHRFFLCPVTMAECCYFDINTSQLAVT